MSITKPTNSENEGYRLSEERVTIDQALLRQPMSCPFQRPCWQTIRAPIATKGFIDEDGRHHRIFMPYICSFSSEGDIEKCGRYWNFMKEKEERENQTNGELST